MNDDDADLELRRALRAEAYRPPMTLRLDSLLGRLAARTERRRTTSRRIAWIAAAISVIAVIAVTSVLQLPRSPGAGQVEPTDRCEVSTVIRHGSWWKEIGGPDAFFNAEPDAFHADPNSWLIIARFDPDALPGQDVQMWADRLGSADHVDGSYNSRMNPTNIYRGSSPAPQLPGGWYLFEQRLPIPGCWRLSAAIDGRVVGTAVLSVRFGTSARVPVGTYRTNQAVAGDPCFAFENPSATYEETTAIRAWSWDPGAGGDCRTRSSDIAQTTAQIVPRADVGYDLALRIEIRPGETREIRVALHVSGGSLAGVAVSANNAPVFFTSVEAVDPTFAPRD